MANYCKKFWDKYQEVTQQKINAEAILHVARKEGKDRFPDIEQAFENLKKKFKEMEDLWDASYEKLPNGEILFGPEYDGLNQLLKDNLKFTFDSFFKELSPTIVNGRIIEVNAFSEVPKLKNIRAFTSFSMLKHLNLSFCNKIQDFSPIQYLKRLEYLDLRGTSLKNLEHIENLRKLTELILLDNNLDSLAGLGKLTNLEILVLFKTKIKEENADTFSEIKMLKKLTTLNMSKTNAKDFSFLENLTGLTALDLEETEVENLDVLKNLTKLAVLDIGNAKKAKNVDALEYHSKLSTLELNGTAVEDISSLKNCPLAELNISLTPVKDISVLRSVASLKKFTAIGCNNLTDLSPLVGLANLRRVSFVGQSVDLDSIQKLNSLTTLELANCSINQIDLSGMPDLVEIKLSGTKITDLKKIKGLDRRNFEIELDLSKTEISDIESLLELPIKKLYLKECPKLNWRNRKFVSDLKRLKQKGIRVVT